MIICVDFDGVCVEETWPTYTSDVPEAGESLRALQAEGHKLIIWTCRVEAEYWGPDSGKRFVREWLLKNELHDVEINRNRPERLKVFYGNQARKVSADVYIDDKNLGGFPGWRKTLEIIRAMPNIPRLADTPQPAKV